MVRHTPIELIKEKKKHLCLWKMMNYYKFIQVTDGKTNLLNPTGGVKTKSSRTHNSHK